MEQRIVFNAVPTAAVLPEEAQQLLEEMLKARSQGYKSDFFRGIHDQGRAEGIRKMIFGVLSARRVAVPDEARVRIAECDDLEQLEAWGRRAANATAIEDVFD
jgi:hypothetical protein